MRIIVAGYGLVAESVVRTLIENHGIDGTNIFCFTYDTLECAQLIRFLRSKEIKFSTSLISNQDAAHDVQDFCPDYIASLYYRHIIPETILSLAKVNTFNIHPALLPKYRGCFSAPWAIINGEIETGITFHEMAPIVDTGNILWQKTIGITASDTGYSLYHRLCAEAIREFDPFFISLVNGKLKSKKMPAGGSYYNRRLPHAGTIDSSWDSSKIECFIRAMFFPPFRGATIRHEGKLLEVTSLEEYAQIKAGANTKVSPL